MITCNLNLVGPLMNYFSKACKTLTVVNTYKYQLHKLSTEQYKTASGSGEKCLRACIILYYETDTIQIQTGYIIHKIHLQ